MSETTEPACIIILIDIIMAKQENFLVLISKQNYKHMTHLHANDCIDEE